LSEVECKSFLRAKVASKHMLMKLTPGWEFTKLLKQIRKIFCNFKVLLNLNLNLFISDSVWFT